MSFSLSGVVKGVVTGLETLAETGNPYIAAGAGALTALSGGGPPATSAPVQTFDPVLDEMSGNLNPGTPSQTYSYTQLAGLDASGNSKQNPDFASIVDDGAGSGGSA